MTEKDIEFVRKTYQAIRKATKDVGATSDDLKLDHFISLLIESEAMREKMDLSEAQRMEVVMDLRDKLSAYPGTRKSFDLRPAVPAPEILKAKAEEINGLLREAALKDDFRPAAIGAIMLALWKSGGNIRRDSKYILQDINRACQQAFWDAGKPDLAKSLRVDETNDKLAIRVRRICEILERLNITTLTAEHDYLGSLYEEFFRYTGGNTIGQYFTPRHITSFMADLCEVDRSDVVLDPACGTGGFLIAAMQRMQRESKLPREQIVKIVKKQLIGLEDEPITAALCVANMILRGDGTTGVLRADCFSDAKFPFDKAHIVLMNPPFPHQKTDTPTERFVERAVQGLKKRGRMAVIVSSSLLVKNDKAKWRRSILEENTLRAVISLPTELFQPYASSTTAILVFEKGVPHHASRPVFFCRIENDGFRLKKGVRLSVPGSQMPASLKAYFHAKAIPEFCATAALHESSGWAPGAYIPARPLSGDELHDEITALIRNKAAFVVRHAPQVAAMIQALNRGDLQSRPYKKAGAKDKNLDAKSLGRHFDIYYGQKELHSKENLSPGLALVISSSGADNGCYGFFDFTNLISPPFVTVPSTGSIGEAAVQEFPCGATDDCLLLIPKLGTPFEMLYIAAASLRRERWRFDYGRKMTPVRIAHFPINLEPPLLKRVREEHDKGKEIEKIALKSLNIKDGIYHYGSIEEYNEDTEDAAVAYERLEEIKRDPSALISGGALNERLRRTLKS